MSEKYLLYCISYAYEYAGTWCNHQTGIITIVLRNTQKTWENENETHMHLTK